MQEMRFANAFDGECLLGKSLDNFIEVVTKEKSTLLPQKKGKYSYGISTTPEGFLSGLPSQQQSLELHEQVLLTMMAFRVGGI